MGDFISLRHCLSAVSLMKNLYETDQFAISLLRCSSSWRVLRSRVQDDFVVVPFWSQFTC